MAKNPVKYAEDTLGVHAVWDEAQDRLELHRSNSVERSKTHTELRTLRRQIADREMDLTAEAPTLWPDANSTERGRLLKVHIQHDSAIQDMRSHEDDLQATLDLLDAEIRHDEMGLRVLAARMAELGGLLQFYSSRTTEERVTSD